MNRTNQSDIAPDTRGQNFYTDDRSLTSIAELYLEPSLKAILMPQLTLLGERVANDLDEAATLANRHPPVLHHRDKFGQDNQWIEYHPSYRVLEQAAFGDFAIHAMSHRPTVEKRDEPLPILAKHLHTFLFNQAEFGLGCPINVTDSAIHLIREYGDESIKKKLLPKMLSNDLGELWQGAQFITEQEGGSDVGRVQTTAVCENGQWYLTGEKWFCSNTDAQVAMILARLEGGVEGTKGLALFAMPRTLEDGTPNRIHIVRLKEKLGTRSMASGEIQMNRAFAYLIGNPQRGFKQMAEMINWSRLSNGVKSAALMRRAVHDAKTVSLHRHVFGEKLIERPLAQRQLLKIMLASEQALSVWVWVAHQLDRMVNSDLGSNEASQVVRLATPVLKMCSTRDARKVCGDAMEIRGGCGYVEDFVNARLVRDAYLGSIWEGTTNIIAIDAISRAVARSQCLPSYIGALSDLLKECTACALPLVEDLSRNSIQVEQFVTRVAEEESEVNYRLATRSLYEITSAVLMLWEGVKLNERKGDASRILWSQLVFDHKISTKNLFEPPIVRAKLNEALLQDKPLSLETVQDLLR